MSDEQDERSAKRAITRLQWAIRCLESEKPMQWRLRWADAYIRDATIILNGDDMPEDKLNVPPKDEWFAEVFEKSPMPAALVAKLTKLRDEGRGKLMLGMALASGDYGCGLCEGYAISCGLAFMLRERIDPEWSIVCDDCAEFLDPALCRAYEKLMATTFGQELNDQQSPLWRHVPDLTEALAAQGLAIWDDKYGYIVPAEAS